eukprot:3778794-Lingulodinium_polyedra.AAC.1
MHNGKTAMRLLYMGSRPMHLQEQREAIFEQVSVVASGHELPGLLWDLLLRGLWVGVHGFQ